MPTIASPAHATNPQGVLAQPNAPLPTATQHQTLAVPEIPMMPQAPDTPTSTKNLPPHNMKARGCMPEMLFQNKQIELQLFNSKIELDKIKCKLREQ